MRRVAQPQIYDSASRRPAALREFSELIAYRELLRMLIIENLKQRYQRSMLGIVWTFLNPLLSMVVLAVAFTALFRSSINNYPVYVLIGLIAWTCFSQTSAQTIEQVVTGSTLMKQIYLPRTIFSVAAVGSGIVNLLFSLIPLFVLMLFTGHPIFATWLLLPAALLLLAMFTLGLGLGVAALALYFSDVGYLYQIIVQAWFFLTPIMYPLQIVPGNIQPWLMLNPITIFVTLLRTLLYNGHIPSLAEWAIASIVAVLTFIGGWLAYTQQSDQLSYRS